VAELAQNVTLDQLPGLTGALLEVLAGHVLQVAAGQVHDHQRPEGEERDGHQEEHRQDT
jgi:hypothetical protein